MKARNVYSFDPASAKPNFGLTLSVGFRVSGARRIDSRRGPRIASREARRAERRARGLAKFRAIDPLVAPHRGPGKSIDRRWANVSRRGIAKALVRRVILKSSGYPSTALQSRR